MVENKSVWHELVTGAEGLLSHVMGIVLGLVLMVAGLAMGVTLVLLPVGLPVGLIGVMLLLWGLFGRAGQGQSPTPPTQL
jgi:hypothetical protein